MATPTAAIYFARNSGSMAQDLAARVRNDGVKTLMLWGDKFRDERDLEGSAAAVIVQKSMKNADIIANVYRRFAAGVEIHFVDDEGEFIGAQATADAKPDTPQQEPSSDAAPEAQPTTAADAD